MIKCSYCGKENMADALSCASCNGIIHSNVKTDRAGYTALIRPAVILIGIIGFCVILFRGCGDINDAEKKTAAIAVPTPKQPTLDDTLAKTEIRASVFLEMEYGKSRDDIDIVAQEWYPAQKMEVVKWRVRDGMEHVYVVTQTRVEGDYSDANNMTVKVVNKYME